MRDTTDSTGHQHCGVHEKHTSHWVNIHVTGAFQCSGTPLPPPTEDLLPLEELQPVSEYFAQRIGFRARPAPSETTKDYVAKVRILLDQDSTDDVEQSETDPPKDWTEHDGILNNSDKYLKCVYVVRGILASSPAINTVWAAQMARQIVSQLAHKEGLHPVMLRE